MPASTATLTKSQAARRQRVLEAALDLGAQGGYDAVQMRDIATTANVALGTIYRYFASKDHLLAEALVEWARDLGRRVNQRPISGDTTAERVDPRVAAGDSGDGERAEPIRSRHHRALVHRPPRGPLPREVGEVMGQIMAKAFPDDFDPTTREDIIRVLGHVWFSSLVGWVNRWFGINQAGDELEIATHLLLDQYG